MRLVPGAAPLVDLQGALADEVGGPVAVVLLDEQVASAQLVSRQVGGKLAPLSQVQACAKGIVRPVGLDSLDQFINSHGALLLMVAFPSER